MPSPGISEGFCPTLVLPFLRHEKSNLISSWLVLDPFLSQGPILADRFGMSYNRGMSKMMYRLMTQ